MTRRWLSTAMLLLTTTTICSGGPAASAFADDTSRVVVTDFYQRPTDLPSTAPGTVIRTQEFIPGLDQLTGISAAATATKVMYISADSRDRPIAVTGTVFHPRSQWTGPGTRPLISLAPGTHGQGDQCLQSRAFEQPIRLSPADAAIEYEMPSVMDLLHRNFAVAVTDYMQAPGTTMQTYLNRVEQGRAVIDIVRAARHLPEIPETGPIGFSGYSQGGGAVAAAAELQPSYAPELDLRAVYAGATPADLARVLQQATTGAGAGIVLWAVNSALATAPHLGGPIGAALSPAGAALLEAAKTQCNGGGLVNALTPSTSYTRSGRPLFDELMAIPEFAAWMRAQNLGSVAPTAPVLVHAGRNDDMVPHGVSVTLVDQWRTRGADVTLLTFEAPPTVPGLLIDHSLPHQLDRDRGLSWLTERVMV